MEYKKIQYRTFNKLFTITPNHFQSKEGYEPVEMFETYGEEVDYAWEMSKQNRCWTILDCDGKLYLNAGYHYVNRLGYIITDQPFDKDYELRWDT
jgi:hypothetical protein